MAKMELNTNKGKKMDFKPKEKRKAKAPSTEYQAAMKKQKQTFLYNTSDDFYAMVCFYNYDEQNRFFDLLGLEKARFTSGYKFEEAMKPYVSEKKLAFKAQNRVQCMVYPDPLQTVPYVEGLSPSEFVLYEWDALMALFALREPEENTDYIVDSGIYSVIVWDTMEHRDSAAQKLGLLKYGIKYLDGSRMIKDWEKSLAKPSK